MLIQKLLQNCYHSSISVNEISNFQKTSQLPKKILNLALLIIALKYLQIK